MTKRIHARGDSHDDNREVKQQLKHEKILNLATLSLATLTLTTLTLAILRIYRVRQMLRSTAKIKAQDNR